MGLLRIAAQEQTRDASQCFEYRDADVLSISTLEGFARGIGLVDRNADLKARTILLPLLLGVVLVVLIQILFREGYGIFSAHWDTAVR